MDLKQDNIEAYRFLELYNHYAHSVDDFIDEVENKNGEELLRILGLARDLYCTPFWQKHCHRLYDIECLVATQYKASLTWKNASEEWKQQAARTLELAAELMMHAVINIVYGHSIQLDTAEGFKELAYKHQLTEEGSLYGNS